MGSVLVWPKVSKGKVYYILIAIKSSSPSNHRPAFSQNTITPLSYHDGSVAEDDAVAEAVDPGGLEPVGGDEDVLAVGRVELERGEVVVWRGGALALQGPNLSLNIVMIAASLTHFVC
jgi:hypothetical protein